MPTAVFSLCVCRDAQELHGCSAVRLLRWAAQVCHTCAPTEVEPLQRSKAPLVGDAAVYQTSASTQVETMQAGEAGEK
jgi:hypothetical protein